MDLPNKEFIFCNRCSNETNHTCLAEHYRDFTNLNPDDSIAFVERLGYRLWVCAGCDTGTLEERYIFDITDSEIMANPSSTYFPERTRFHAKSKHFRQLPSSLTRFYRETLRAFNNDLDVLCAIGIRVLLEGICADKDIRGSSLETRIDNMTAILPKNIVTNLHNIRFIGNEAAHELTAPTKKELKLSIEILEDLLNYLYELDYKMHALGSSRKIQKPTPANKTIKSSSSDSG